MTKFKKNAIEYQRREFQNLEVHFAELFSLAEQLFSLAEQLFSLAEQLFSIAE